jgi:hypothetical protein
MNRREYLHIKCDRKINIKGKMGETEVTMAYLDVLTSYLPVGSEEKHGKPVRTAELPATIQNGHFLNINCVHCCWATIFNKKDLKFSR